MLAQQSIGVKLRIGVGLLAVSTCLLFFAALYGLYAYRGLAKSLSARSAELPLANELSQHVADLRVVLGKARERALTIQRGRSGYTPIDYAAEEGGLSQPASIAGASQATDAFDLKLLRQQYQLGFERFKETLGRYRERLAINSDGASSRIAGAEPERETLAEIDATLDGIRRDDLEYNLLLDELGGETDSLEAEIERLRELAARLPSHLHNRLRQLSGEVRSQYHVAIVLSWATFVSACLLLVGATQVFRTTIARPLRLLAGGARKVAAGDFAHRIELDSRDEMGELADAMNRMMANFQRTRDDLDQQVKQRTEQVIRAEQLASVGNLAASVAHELNNPLNAITMSSESLQGRLAELAEEHPAEAAEWEVVRSYMDMIRKESDRCGRIISDMVGLARMGDRARTTIDLRAVVEDMVGVVRNLGKYKSKEAVLSQGEAVWAHANAQELKQVVLNLITNAFDSLEPGGRVVIDARRVATHDGDRAQIVVADDGCGMDDATLGRLFDPFFTNNHTRQGTGLGLSISYRIVQEHQGELTAHSDGPGHGSTFTVSLPAAESPSGRAAA
ncbi:MAG: HAMP domain-containing sensor histidine kinase [Planctomycetota bacterium]